MGQYDSLKQDILGLSTLGAAALWEIPEARTVFDEFKQLLKRSIEHISLSRRHPSTF